MADLTLSLAGRAGPMQLRWWEWALMVALACLVSFLVVRFALGP